MTEYEVLKRHDVYVVRKVGEDIYAARFCDFSIAYGPVGWWALTGDREKAYKFSRKWRAILHAKSLEREARVVEKYSALCEARKSAPEERVWR